eukprot:GHVQ01039633.1.p1 GENE.GHVQ01039633.1~~GHVQ01039633.1.p1  ORF type:complete len:289 (+),score=43.95 GHVQ01039633.1:225-1091(+)
MALTAFILFVAATTATASHELPSNWSLQTVRPVHFQSTASSDLHKQGHRKHFKGIAPIAYGITDNAEVGNRSNTVTVGDDRAGGGHALSNKAVDHGGNYIGGNPIDTTAALTEAGSGSEGGIQGGFLETRRGKLWDRARGLSGELKEMFFRSKHQSLLKDKVINMWYGAVESSGVCNEKFHQDFLLPTGVPFEENARYASAWEDLVELRDKQVAQVEDVVAKAAATLACYLGRLIVFPKFFVSECGCDDISVCVYVHVRGRMGVHTCVGVCMCMCVYVWVCVFVWPMI